MRALYKKMLEEDTLFFLFPEATGDWNKDKERFIELCNTDFEDIIEEWND